MVAVLSVAPPARADPITLQGCIQANEQAGPLRREGKLRDARAKLRSCSAASCPAAVRSDCVAGAAQADADVPTVAFSVQDPSGNDLVAVKVSIDGLPLVESLDGKAVDVDPGAHVFRFESAGLPVVEKRLVIVEGQKNRREQVRLGEVKPVAVVAPVAAPAPAAPVFGPAQRRTIGYTVGVGGLVALAGGGVAAIVATLEWSAAKQACGPTFPQYCVDAKTANADASATLRAGAGATILLIAGGVAVVGGVGLVLSAPPGAPAATTTGGLTIAPAVGSGTGGLMLRGSF